MKIQFGLTANDYSKYRFGYPLELFERLQQFNVGLPEQKILDIGTGTGYLARPLAKQGSHVVGLDPSDKLLEQAKKLDRENNVSISYVTGQAENLPFEDNSFDVVTAGQCWHWFDSEKAVQEVYRVLKKDGKLIIVHFDWIPLEQNVVAQTEELILKFNPEWKGANGKGIYPQWLNDVALGGFEDIETFTFDVPVSYSHEGWRGRIRASAGVGASLSEKEVEQFDKTLAELLKANFKKEPMLVPHRTFCLICRKPF